MICRRGVNLIYKAFLVRTGKCLVPKGGFLNPSLPSVRQGQHYNASVDHLGLRLQNDLQALQYECGAVPHFLPA